MLVFPGNRELHVGGGSGIWCRSSIYVSGMDDGWMSELMKERRERGGNNVGSYLESLNLVTPIFFNFMHIPK